MSSVSLSALHLGSLGAAGGLFLLMALLLLRDRRASTSGRLAVLLTLGAAAHAANAAHLIPAGIVAVRTPLLLLAWGTPAAFWLWARAAFDDGFRPRWWHAALWALLPVSGLLVTSGHTAWLGGDRIADAALPSAGLAFALLAAGQTVATWRADLVAARLRLRAIVLIGAVAYMAGETYFELAPPRPGAPMIGTAEAVALCALALLAGWTLLRVPADDPAALAADSTPPAPSPGPPPVDPALLRRLDHLMRVERVYRQENLTIGALAARLKLPEYRLRQGINEGLGYRNFNAFLNAFRLAEAKAALADPAQQAVPVLTIAMDAGFQSIGPFNRAFKADTGLTPTEYRRTKLLLSRGISEIGQPG